MPEQTRHHLQLSSTLPLSLQPTALPGSSHLRHQPLQFQQQGEGEVVGHLPPEVQEEVVDPLREEVVVVDHRKEEAVVDRPMVEVVL